MKNTEQPIKSQPFTEEEMTPVKEENAFDTLTRTMVTAKKNSYNQCMLDVINLMDNSTDLDLRERILKLYKP